MKLHGAYMLCEEPIVLLGPEGPYMELRARASSLPAEVHFIRMFTWTQHRFKHVLASASKYRRRGRLIAHHACNDELEYRRFRRAGMRSLWLNHNALLAEAVFDYDGTRERRFDAVYNAVAWPYKRVWLAAEIESLRLITATDPKWHHIIAEQGCGHAEVNPRRLSPTEVAAALNECRCGLALSAEEGAMFACGEYLLCGLPVVSTPSRGGRDVWFDDYNSIIVEPTPDAVKAAVERLVNEPRDPQRIRDGMLQRMQRFRQTLVDYVNQKIAGQRVVELDDLFGDGRGLTDRFVDTNDLPALLASHRQGEFGERALIGGEAVIQ